MPNTVRVKGSFTSYRKGLIHAKLKENISKVLREIPNREIYKY